MEMMDSLNVIKNNIAFIKNNIAEAAAKSNRTADDITLVGVTKTIDAHRIKQMISCGVNDIGENRVQELTGKYESVGSGYDWHLIGHLQTNKVKYIIDKVKLIHSVDSLKLAGEINSRAAQLNIISNILLEINIADEGSKFGINYDNIYEFIKNISNLSNISIRGLMTVAPFVSDGEKNRNYFKKMFQLLVDINGKNYDNISMSILSMGMTNDYVTAIEEGANMVRIGTGIFGNR